MSKPYVYLTRPLHQEALERISKHAQIKAWNEDSPIPRQTLLNEAAQAVGMITMLSDRIDSELMDHAPNLKVVSNFAVGYDNIDIPEAVHRGIKIGNTPGVLSGATADLAFALLMATARRVVESHQLTLAGKWNTWELYGLLGQEVHGSTLGIIGLGRIGFEMAKRAHGFDMPLLYYNRSRNERAENELGAKRVELDALLKESDFVSLHCPLTEETKGLIGERELSLMKPGAILINTSRGAVINQEALYHALKENRIGGAGLDVFQQEPIPADDPLLKLPNVVVTPHIGSATTRTRQQMALIAADNLIAGINGDPLPFEVKS